jgi:hypothetical protein
MDSLESRRPLRHLSFAARNNGKETTLPPGAGDTTGLAQAKGAHHAPERPGPQRRA